jgi:hypothetical protein
MQIIFAGRRFYFCGKIEKRKSVMEVLLEALFEIIFETVFEIIGETVSAVWRFYFKR